MSGVELPEGWVLTSLEDVLLSIVGGGTPSKSNAQYYKGSIPWMSVKDMNKNILEDTVDHISQEAVENSSTNIIPAGTPIIATRMSLGKIIVAKFDSAINQDLKALFPAKDIVKDYLIGWYRSNSMNIESLGTGTTVKGIRLEVLKALNFPLPPLAEQKVIAEKLDTLLAQVETTKAHLERIPETLKRFRQSVLAAAVSGKLTEEWRKSIFTKPFQLDSEAWDVPSEWNELSLSEVIDSKNPICYGVVQPGDEVPCGKKLIRVCDINDGEIDFSGLRTISREIDSQYTRSKISKGDVLVTIVGAIGRIGIVRESIDANIARAVAKLSPNVKLVHPVYLYTWLSSPALQWWLINSSKEVARKTLNLKELKEAPVALPSLEEQAQIVRRVEQLFALADNIEQKANAALERVNNLSQSILAKAFRGELTEQWRAENKDLISGENSAEALLQKIKAEREAVVLKKKARTKKRA